MTIVVIIVITDITINIINFVVTLLANYCCLHRRMVRLLLLKPKCVTDPKLLTRWRRRTGGSLRSCRRTDVDWWSLLVRKGNCSRLWMPCLLGVCEQPGSGECVALPESSVACLILVRCNEEGDIHLAGLRSQDADPGKSSARLHSQGCLLGRLVFRCSMYEVRSNRTHTMDVYAKPAVIVFAW